jgi:hypothetical protein
MIRSFPMSMSASDVVAEMKKRGVLVGANVVFAVRSRAKTKTPRAVAPKAPPPVDDEGNLGEAIVSVIERIVDDKIKGTPCIDPVLDGARFVTEALPRGRSVSA